MNSNRAEWRPERARDFARERNSIGEGMNAGISHAAILARDAYAAESNSLTGRLSTVEPPWRTSVASPIFSSARIVR